MPDALINSSKSIIPDPLDFKRGIAGIVLHLQGTS